MTALNNTHTVQDGGDENQLLSLYYTTAPEAKYVTQFQSQDNPDFGRKE